MVAAIVAALLCRDCGGGSARWGFTLHVFGIFWLLRRVMVSCKFSSYCFSVVSKDHEYDHLVTLLPSAAALISGTFHDPASLQLLSGWTFRCSSICDILEFQLGSSFPPSSGKEKRESANDESLLLVTSDEEFVSPQVRQLGGCVSAGPSAASQAVVTTAASYVYLPVGGFLTLVEPYIVFVVVTGSAAAALTYCTPFVCSLCRLTVSSLWSSLVVSMGPWWTIVFWSLR